MKATQLYQFLEDNFITSTMSDDWARHMGAVSDFLCENYKKRSMGLVCDFTSEINKVYTAVFPSDDVMQQIINYDAHDALLFVHHPSTWDIRKAPDVFQQMNTGLLQQFKERRISIYNLHVPLDSFSEYSTSTTFAKALGITPDTPFAPYFGALCGVYGKTDITTVQDLKRRCREAVGHEVSLYNYGDSIISNKTVAVIAGGGNDIDFLKDISKAGINTFLTGITIKNDVSKSAHEFAEKNGINILGGTHYSTERFACISMIDCFTKAGIASEFIEDEPILEDL